MHLGRIESGGRRAETFCIFAKRKKKKSVEDLHFCVSLWFCLPVSCRLWQWLGPPVPAVGKGQEVGQGW